jgi:hypothetical protein
VLSGRLPDEHGIAAAFRSHFAHAFFTLLHDSFLQKSGGGADQWGDRWKPLTPQTIAARPLSPGDVTAAGTRGLGRGGIGLLTIVQARVWRGIFASTLARTGDAGHAARTAWAILKARGARTRLEAYGRRKVPILVHTGRLLASLSPGRLSGDTYTPPPEQVLEWSGTRFRMGTAVPYASRQHKTRRLWPTVERMRAWVSKSVKAAVKVLIGKLEKLG